MLKYGTWLAVVLMVSAAGCGGDDGSSSGPPSVAMTCTPTSAASGATISAAVTVTNFTLVAPTEPPSANVEGEGHYHIYLDSNTGTNYLTAGIAATSMITIGNAAAGWTVGAHTLKIELQNNDHSIVPDTLATCNVTVQ